MDKPTHHDVDVILKLYELRREDRMRKMNSANPKAYETFLSQGERHGRVARVK